jgi:hypothetical protein
MPYIGKSPQFGVRSRFYYTQSSAGGTSVSGTDDNGKTLKFSDGEFVDVMLNGVTLVAGTDYNTSTANTIAGLAALSNGDVVEVVVYDTFSVSDTVSAKDGGTFSSAITANSGLNVGTIKEATGSTTAMTIDSSGQVLMSAIPYARLEVSGEVSTALSSGAIGIVPYNNVLASRGITHNTSTYTFQVPVAGLYNFQGGLRWQKETSYLWWRVAQSDGTVVQNVLVISTGNSSGFVTCLGSILLPLAASTDYQIQFGDGSTSNSRNVYGGQSYMTIHLVGAS